MEKRSRITIMDGEVVTFARGFSSRPGVFGDLHEAQAPFEVSASRNRICVHRADLGSDESVELFIEAIRAAQAEARSLAHKDRGNYRRAAHSERSQALPASNKYASQPVMEWLRERVDKSLAGMKFGETVGLIERLTRENADLADEVAEAAKELGDVSASSTRIAHDYANLLEQCERLTRERDTALKQLGALAAMILQDDRQGAKDWARGVTIVIGKDGAPLVALSGEPNSAPETKSNLDESKLWSFLRDVMTTGCAIETDTRNLGRRYEEHSARLDAAARDAVPQFFQRLGLAEKATGRPAPQGHVCPSGWCPVCQSTL